MENESDVIDLKRIFSLLWSNRKKFYKLWGLVFILTYGLLLFVPRYYTTTTRIAPELGSAMDMGSLGDLASSIGLNFGDASHSDAISPLLYPDLMDDNGFVAKLFDIHVTSVDGEIDTTYHDYLAKYQKYAFWKKWMGKLKKLIIKKNEIKGSQGEYDPYYVSRKEDGLMKLIRSNISFQFDKKTFVVTIKVKAQDPLICRQVADATRIKLQDFITEYRTTKARFDLEYYQKLADDTKSEYEEACIKYSRYADSHLNMSMSTYNNQLDNLQKEMEQKYTSYTAVITQKEAAKARVQESTPAFTTLQGASVPVKPAGPKRMFIVITMLFLSSMVMGLYILKDELLR